jgi:AAA domain, putative AbiEii toxin, Type IV TA system/AAA domain
MKEPEDVYFSKEQIEQSIKRLNKFNPFLGITFLAFKKAGLPKGTTKSINSIQILEDFLQKYYHPLADYDGFYTPFKTWDNKKKRWNSVLYANTLHVTATRTFSDVLFHPGGSAWGWQTDYIDALQKKHLKKELIPVFDLSVWLFRAMQWDKNIHVEDITATFFKEFAIADDELKLFERHIPPLTTPWLQEKPIDTEELLNIIGSPPDRVTEGATLKTLKLTSVGPAKQVEFKPATRLNLITGDNGLGKTFLLECAWWALTGTWAGYPARPRYDAAKDVAGITFQIGKEHQPGKAQTVKYNWDQLRWDAPAKRNVLPGLSLFSQANGSFVVWDPAKHILAGEDHSTGREGEALTRFSRADVWNGVRETDQSSGLPRVLCNGLINDWIRWQEAADQTRFEELSAALYSLSPNPDKEPLIPGKPASLSEVGDDRDIPTLKFPYGDVPILLCSAGIQRIVALAYLLVWAWQSHVKTAEAMRKSPEQSIVLLIDEMEAHLHPFWQRTIVPALMGVVHKLTSKVQVQMIIATHSPLVLASVEPLFNDEMDNLFHLYLKNGLVQLDEMPFVKRGRVDQWLTSDIFGLVQPRSIDAEKAIEVANKIQLENDPPQEEVG